MVLGQVGRCCSLQKLGVGGIVGPDTPYSYSNLGYSHFTKVDVHWALARESLAVSLCRDWGKVGKGEDDPLDLLSLLRVAVAPCTTCLGAAGWKFDKPNSPEGMSSPFSILSYR